MIIVGCSSKNEKKTVRKNPDVLPYFNSYDLTPQWGEGKEVKKHKIAPFSFTNQDGKKVSKQDYDGKIYVSHFFFTSCTSICKVLINNMSLLQENFEGDENVKFISHSVTPEIDSVQKLKEYADYHQINSKQWSLVTGNKDEIYKIARESYFSDDDFKESKKASTFIHSENFLLVDPTGHIRGVYNGTLNIEIDRITNHIKLLKKEFNIK